MAPVSSLAAPVQFHRPVQRMFPSPIETGLLQGEIPFGGFVGIVDEHEAGVVFEAFGLLDHGELILTDEFRSEEFGNRREEWHVVEDVPGGDDVDTAGGRVTGVTVVSEENHLSPERMISVRRLGSVKSMVVATGWP